MAAHFGAVCPERRIRVVNRGVSGNTVRDLAARWERDVLATAADWIAVVIGINDVWRQFDQPLVPEAAVPPDAYAETLHRFVGETRGRHLILMTPFIIEPNRHEPMRTRMDEYGAIVRKTAKKHRTLFIDTQAAFDAVLRHTHPMALA